MSREHWIHSMRRSLKRGTTLTAAFFLTFASNLPAQADSWRTYVVARGDTASVILHKFGIKPIYGKKGALRQLLNLNPELRSAQGDVIYPGNRLRLPIAEEIRYPASIAEETPRTVLPLETQASGLSPYSEAEIAAGLAYFALEGVDPRDGTHGLLISGLSPSLRAAWIQHWSDTLASRIFVGLHSISFQSERTGLSLQGASVLNSEFGLGIQSKFSDVLRLGADFGVTQAMFYRAVSSSSLEIFQTPVFFLRPNFEYTLVKKKPFTISAFGNAGLLGGSSYDGHKIEAGYLYSGGLRLLQEFKNSDLSCEGAYGERLQNTDFLKITQKNLGFNCAFRWRL